MKVLFIRNYISLVGGFIWILSLFLFPCNLRWTYRTCEPARCPPRFKRSLESNHSKSWCHRLKITMFGHSKRNIIYINWCIMYGSFIHVLFVYQMLTRARPCFGWGMSMLQIHSKHHSFIPNTFFFGEICSKVRNDQKPSQCHVESWKVTYLPC